VSTGSNGIARLTSWILGGIAGVNTVSAKFVGPSAPVVTFSATGTERYTLVVFAKRADGTAIQDAQICVGSRTDPDQYAAVKSGGTYGRATFTITGGPEYAITAAKSGFIGRTVYQAVTGTSGSAIVTLSPGSGGTTCPGMAIQYDGTTSIPLPLDAAPARLGEERLTGYGTFAVNTTAHKTLDCNSFGTAAVMVGLKGRHGLGVDELNVLCQRIQSDGKLNSTLLTTERWDDIDAAGTAFTRQCGPGYVVSGVTYTGENLQVRSMALHCTPIGINGLTSGTAIVQAPIGTPRSTARSTLCTGGRPGRAFRLSSEMIRLDFVSDVSPTVYVIGASQLYCEQPVKP
jgi:hypothetical protein